MQDRVDFFSADPIRVQAPLLRPVSLVVSKLNAVTLSEIFQSSNAKYTALAITPLGTHSSCSVPELEI